MLQLTLIEGSALRRALWLFPQTLPIRDHERPLRRWCGKPTDATHNERIEKVVESAGDDFTFETGVHCHHICIKTAHGLG